MKKLFLIAAAVAALTLLIGVPASFATPGDNGTACLNHPDSGIPPFCVPLPSAAGGNGGGGGGFISSDSPRGLWCNGLGILTLPVGFMVAPLNAVDLLIIDGKALEAAGLVGAADY